MNQPDPNLSTAPHAPLQRTAAFRFYEELNDFLPTQWKKKTFSYTFTGTPSVKDLIEAIGVPHPEADLILIDGTSAGFDARLTGGERVAVYPVFERFDISSVGRLRARPLREPRFVADVHLGRLARYLRLLGFDTLYRNDYEDPTLVRLSAGERRILLTRDKGVLKHGAVTHGYWVRATDPAAQLRELVQALDLRSQFRPFTRCTTCNGLLHRVGRDEVRDRLPEGVRDRFDTFSRCGSCSQLYWAGTHYERMQAFIDGL